MRNAIILCLALGPVNVVAQCQVPQFRPGRIFVREEDTVIESISMPLQAFGPRNLACLAKSVKERYRDRKNILIYIFSSPEAAQVDPAPMETSEWDMKAFRQQHAFYMLDAAKHQDYIQIFPAGAQGVVSWGPYSTRIDLPTNALPPHCRLEINSRCLIAMDYVLYPDETLKKREAGTVVLAATVTRGGKTDKVRVLKMESASPKAESLLAKAAVETLSSWIFEPASSDDVVQITFSYLIDDAVRHEDGEQIEWALPNKVTIKYKPPG